ncbi:MAG TPA: sensor histidine kinase, partial [Myxococcaceae bacterium]|nr:sensor histidine kinase [Myxococcaceae bacterium]
MADQDDRLRLEQAELFAPGLIHEMRHPLMGIKAGLQLISRQLGEAVTQQEEWQLVAGQLARL